MMSGSKCLRLEKIDETTRPDHAYITESDTCYYMVEYRAGTRDFSIYGNQLISNLKKTNDRKGKREYRYKEEAIQEVAQFIAVMDFGPGKVVIIPAPSSKSHDDPDYDDRLMLTLRTANIIRAKQGKHEPFVISECVKTKVSRQAQHCTDNRMSPAEMYETLEFSEEDFISDGSRYIFFDDMLTAGTTSSTTKRIISENTDISPSEITGLFVARRVPDTSEAFTIDDFDDLFD